MIVSYCHLSVGIVGYHHHHTIFKSKGDTKAVHPYQHQRKMTERESMKLFSSIHRFMKVDNIVFVIHCPSMEYQKSSYKWYSVCHGLVWSFFVLSCVCYIHLCELYTSSFLLLPITHTRIIFVSIMALLKNGEGSKPTISEGNTGGNVMISMNDSLSEFKIILPSFLKKESSYISYLIPWTIIMK